MYVMYVCMYVSHMTYGDFGIAAEWLCGDLCHCEDKTYVPTKYVCMYVFITEFKKKSMWKAQKSSSYTAYS